MNEFSPSAARLGKRKRGSIFMLDMAFGHGKFSKIRFELLPEQEVKGDPVLQNKILAEYKQTKEEGPELVYGEDF